MNLRIRGKKQGERPDISVAETHIDESMRGKEDVSVKLAEMWQKLLGVESVGPDDDYFVLGGDSILAVQLFCEIEATFGVKMPVASLFDAPTIASLSGMIEREVPALHWSPLVPIQRADTRPPFFCVHGAGGNVLIYRDLSRHLGADQPFYGLQSQGLDGRSSLLETVEEMAALYVKEIRGVQPNGPYFLGGYCGGGTIAYEVAQQLQTSGERVALLALFDTMNWSKLVSPAVFARLYHVIQKLRFHAGNFALLDAPGKSAFLREKLNSVHSRIPVWKGTALSWFGFDARDGRAEARLLARIWHCNDRACGKYVPEPYDGLVTDFRPTKQYRMYSRPNLKWSQLAKEGEGVIILPVYPAGMLVEPFVRELAAQLRRSIDNAMRRCEDTVPARQC